MTVRKGNIRHWLTVPDIIARRMPPEAQANSKARNAWLLEAAMQRLERERAG